MSNKDVMSSRLKLSMELDKEVSRLGIERLTKSEQASLHYAWMVHGDQEAYHKLYLYAMRLVYKIVNKLDGLNMLGSSTEDAISNGVIGVAEGLRKWEPNRSALTSYVWVRIRGTVLDASAKDWHRGMVGSRRNSGGSPVIYDPDHMFGNGMDFQTTQYTAANRKPDWETDNPCEQWAEIEEVQEVVARELSPVQQKVINLLYTHDLTQRETGDVMGLTQQRVDQLHQEALRVLKGVYL
jgi:RNA polymerase sigma factor (sigma-70 family)